MFALRGSHTVFPSGSPEFVMRDRHPPEQFPSRVHGNEFVGPSFADIAFALLETAGGATVIVVLLSMADEQSSCVVDDGHHSVPNNRPPPRPLLLACP